MDIIELAEQAKSEVIITNKQDGFENPEYIITVWAFEQHQLQQFTDLVIKQYNVENPVIVTDNTQTIANMEVKIAELEAKLAMQWRTTMNNIKQALESISKAEETGNLQDLVNALDQCKAALEELESVELHQREWVGLSASDINSLIDEMHRYTDFDFIKLVEAKLRELNTKG